jgi:hypothetical protein
LRAARKGNVVRLTWTIPTLTTDRESLRYLGKTRVCRSLAEGMKNCETPVGEVEPPADFAKARKSTSKKMTASYADTLTLEIQGKHPMGFATYAVEVLNTAGREAGISNQVRVALVPTLPPFGGFGARSRTQGILLSWECHGVAGAPRDEIKYLFRIYRHEAGKTSEVRIAQIDAGGCAAGSADEKERSFLDQSFEWEHTYFYRGTVVSVVEASGKASAEVEGDDTPEVKVFAHDIFPPAVPNGLQAVFSGLGQKPFVDLIWAPVTDADLEGYNVYRHEEGAAAVRLNSEPVKTPAYRDMQVEPRKTYFYSVSAVDQQGNESARSEEASERVP